MYGLLVLATYLTTALAAPTLSWTPALGSFYAAVDSHIQNARRDGTVTPPTCDLSKAVQPVAPTPLPVPDPSWTLSEVVIGRGVQVSSPSLFPIYHSTKLTFQPRTTLALSHQKTSSPLLLVPLHHCTMYPVWLPTTPTFSA